MRVLCTWWAKTSKCVSLSLSLALLILSSLDPMQNNYTVNQTKLLFTKTRSDFSSILISPFTATDPDSDCPPFVLWCTHFGWQERVLCLSRSWFTDMSSNAVAMQLNLALIFKYNTGHEPSRTFYTVFWHCVGIYHHSVPSDEQTDTPTAC